jgi:two-component sensor histidine kinase
MSDKNGFVVPVPEALKLEAGHRIANNLAMLSSLMRLHATEAIRSKKTYSPEEVGALLQELSGRVETVATLHRVLASADDDSLVQLDRFLREICTNLCSLSADHITLSINCLGSESIKASKALPIGLMVAELITNSVKYAHPSNVPLKLDVTYKRHSDKSICIEVSDDGVGYPEGFDTSKDGGLGFRVMRSLAQQINAELEFTSDELGASCKIIVRPRRPVARAITYSSWIARVGSPGQEAS